MRLLHENRCCKYYRLEIASEVDKIEIPEEDEGFDFFHGLGIVGYEKAFKMWLRKFPRPILIVALRDRKVLGWAFAEEWGQASMEGLPVYVLRAIEVLPEKRGKKIGRTLVALVLGETTGYLITKPLTPEAENFFRNIGFMGLNEFTKPPIDLTKNPKYLVFPIYKRDMVIKDFIS